MSMLARIDKDTYILREYAWYPTKTGDFGRVWLRYIYVVETHRYIDLNMGEPIRYKFAALKNVDGLLTWFYSIAAIELDVKFTE